MVRYYINGKSWWVCTPKSEIIYCDRRKGGKNEKIYVDVLGEMSKRFYLKREDCCILTQRKYGKNEK